ncbi:C-X-C motif chemokine 6-like isoform X2 [Acanthopagrus latus]|uniref:C-X-C motif chemokine 6-like isoform X2 n=1 Tax=Acanthopagrus latus TaxID=8177 RepID=UPI00187CC72C|nr:C-X-C motif chemokine 6-like isoform X2 [Acanthopagrus latus]
MSTSIVKVFLLLAVAVCISQAQPSPTTFSSTPTSSSSRSTQEPTSVATSMLSVFKELGSGKQCLCSRVKRLDTSDVKDVQIFQATVFCNRVEIVVTTNSGYRYCLDPKRRPVQQLVASIIWYL